MPGLHQCTCQTLPHGPLCFFPQIKLWDLRNNKCVRQYEGHVNEYAHLPLHVHEEEGIVVAGTWGQEDLSHQILSLRTSSSFKRRGRNYSKTKPTKRDLGLLGAGSQGGM